jgi:hypothetical protein
VAPIICGGFDGWLFVALLILFRWCDFSLFGLWISLSQAGQYKAEQSKHDIEADKSQLSHTAEEEDTAVAGLFCLASILLLLCACSLAGLCSSASQPLTKQRDKSQEEQ